jgi:hypothetical protein
VNCSAWPPDPRIRWWAAGFFLFLITACSALPPLREGPEGFSPGQAGRQDSGPILRSRSDLQAITAPDIPALRPQWQPAGGEYAVFAGRIKKPRLEFWAVRIVLNYAAPEPGEASAETRQPAKQRILIGAGKENASPYFGHVASTRVSSFVRNNGLVVGINTVPFEPSSAREGEDRTVVGLGVSEGRLIAPPVPRFDALVFYRDGRAAIVGQWELPVTNSEDSPGKTLPPEILHAAGGFHCILRDGELTGRARQKSPRYARSAAGISADGKTLYLIAINGGRLMNRGATEAETALILKQLGADDALNLDGGGSSALVLRFPTGAADSAGDSAADAAGDGVVVLNTPVHSGLPGRERAVALCLGIGADSP